MTQGRWRCVNRLIHEILQSSTHQRGISLANREYSHKRGISASAVDKRFTRCLLLYGDLFAFWKMFLNRWYFKEGNPSHSSVASLLCKRIITWQLEFPQHFLKSQQKRKISPIYWQNISHRPSYICQDLLLKYKVVYVLASLLYDKTTDKSSLDLDFLHLYRIPA